MAIKKKDLKKIEQDLGKFWARTRTYLKKAADESLVLAKKSEKSLKALSEKGKLAVEALVLKTKQEKLIHELGKIVARTGRVTSEKVKAIRSQIKGLDKEIKTKERKASRI